MQYLIWCVIPNTNECRKINSRQYCVFHPCYCFWWTLDGTGTFRAQDLSFPRTNSPYGELSFPILFVPGNFRSPGTKVPGTFVPGPFHHITSPSHWDDRRRPRRPLYPRDKCLSYDFIIRKIANILHYGSRCHGDLLCSHTICPDQTKTYLDGF